MISGLLLLLELLLLCLAVSLGAYMLEAKKSSSPLTCTSVPYPFGISGKAMKGFEITCNGTSPILQLGNHACKIEDISLQQGNLSIYAGAIAQGCFTSSTQVPSWIDLEGTPYTISDTQNMLTMFGCDKMVHIHEISSSSSDGCTASCDDSNPNVVNGSCNDSGCCQFPIITTGLKRFNVTIESMGQASSNCSETFLVKQSSLTFSKKMLHDVMSGRFLHDRYLMVLDWAIGNEPCEEARKKKQTYACKENSYCYDSTNGVGYSCNCSDGYHGNP